MTWSESDLENISGDCEVVEQDEGDDPPPRRTGDSDVPEAVAEGHEPDFRSKTERRYSRHLDRSEHVAWWAFEPASFRIGEKRHYRPDFMVVRTDGGVSMIEVKGGYIRDRALVKPSAAATIYPQFDWAVVLQSSKGSDWEVKWHMPNREDRSDAATEVLIP